MNITEFLEARIAEDEQLARAASHQKIAGPFHGNWRKDSLHLSGMEREDAAHIARHDPARVLAECAAKRAIIALYERNRANRDARRSPRARAVEDAQATQDRRTQEARTRVAEDAILALATVYAPHPDYDPAWSPDAR